MQTLPAAFANERSPSAALRSVALGPALNNAPQLFAFFGLQPALFGNRGKETFALEFIHATIGKGFAQLGHHAVWQML